MTAARTIALFARFTTKLDIRASIFEDLAPAGSGAKLSIGTVFSAAAAADGNC